MEWRVKCYTAADNFYGTKTNNSWDGALGDLDRFSSLSTTNFTLKYAVASLGIEIFFRLI